MKHYHILFFFLVLMIVDCCAQQPPAVTTFILLRHAEKVDNGDDPELKPEGQERANKISAMLKNTRVDAIYSTSYERTRNTVKPLALNKGLDVQSYEAHQAEVIEAMLRKHAGGTIVISGHSNNIPWIANLLTGKEEYKNYADDEYGIMLIVSVVEKGKVAKVLRLDY